MSTEPAGAKRSPATEATGEQGIYSVFVSRYAAGADGGIQVFRLDTRSGGLSPVCKRGDGLAFFMTLSPAEDVLFSVRAEQEESGPATGPEEIVAWSVAGERGLIRETGRVPTLGRLTCYLAQAGPCLLTADYVSGELKVFPARVDEWSGGPLASVRLAGRSMHPNQEASHPHSIVCRPSAGDGPQFVYAADLGSDRVMAYLLHTDRGVLEPLDPPWTASTPGAGPRHIVFGAEGRRMYVVHELSSTITVYDCDGASGKLAPLQSVDTFPLSYTGETSCADVAITPDGRFLYATNRGHDSLALFRVLDDGTLAPDGWCPSGGAGPQNVAVSPDGSVLLCANLSGNGVAVFRIDVITGALAPVGRPVDVRAPACVLIGKPGRRDNLSKGIVAA